MPTRIGNPTFLVAFLVVIVFFIAVDLGIVRREARPTGPRQALAASAFWILLALAFAGWVFVRGGQRPALEFVTGYIVEKALSVDNLFVILVTLNAFDVPKELWHRVLAVGVLGALVMRGVLIAAGTALFAHFQFATMVFGGILVALAIRVLLSPDESPRPPKASWAVRMAERVFPATQRFYGTRLFAREGGRLVATPLLFAVIAVEAADLLFAVDSIPAVFGVTSDPFLVFTSNAFAILGLRSLFLALHSLVARFTYLKPAIGIVLIFVGAKMVLSRVVEVPIGISLGVIVLILGAAVAASSFRPSRQHEAP